MPNNRTMVDLDALATLFRHRIARAADLVRLGLSSTSVYARCRPGGPWQRLLPGILLLANSPPTRAQLAEAALRYAEPNAMLTGSDALALHGIRTGRPDGAVHVLIPGNRQVRSSSVVLVERTTPLPNPCSRKGFIVAPAGRATLDAARQLTSTEEIRALIGAAVRDAGLRPGDLLAELNAGTRRGSALPRRVLTELCRGVDSPTVAQSRRLVAVSGLPPPRWKVPVRDREGSLLAVVDAWWDDVGLAWEIDSHQYPAAPPGPTAAGTTRARGHQLTAAGVTAVRTIESRLRHDPKAVVAELRRAYAKAKTHPRPPVAAS